MNEEQNLELKVMIDDFINRISGQSVVETVVVIDYLLDVRNIVEGKAVPV